MKLKSSVLPGVVISFGLFGFASLLFFTLFVSRHGGEGAQFDAYIWGLLKFTLFQAFLSTLFSIMVGLVLAWSLAHQPRFKGRSLLVALFSSSLVLPTLVVAFGLIAVYGRNGWINHITLYLFDISLGSYLYGLFGILLAHVYLNASFSARSFLHAFESIPQEKYKLAKSLGFSSWSRFVYVEFPALKSTIFSVAITIFLLCFTSFAIVLLLGGSPAYNTLEVAIYEAVRMDFDIDMALKLALLQLSISTLLVVFSSLLKSNTANLQTDTVAIPWRETKWLGYLQVAVIVLFSLFFLTPLMAIMIDGLGADFTKIFSDGLFIKSFVTSIVLAGIASTLSVIVTLLLSDARRNFTAKERLREYKYAHFFNLFIAFCGNLYLAIPSLVMGLGFFLLAQRYELSAFLWAGIAVIVANVLMTLPFSLSVLSPIMQKTAARYDRLAFSLGLGYWQRWVYCELPYLKPALAYVFALSFCFSLGDLGIIALFGSEDFSTLPWYLYSLLGSYRTSDAAGVALILLALVLTLFIMIARLFGRIHVEND